MRTENVVESGFDRGIQKKGRHCTPITRIIGFRRKANCEIICLVRPVQSIEPVPGVVAVPIKRLRAENIVSRVKKWYSLRQADQGNAKIIDTNPIIHGRGDRYLILVNVEYRLVIVGRD